MKTDCSNADFPDAPEKDMTSRNQIHTQKKAQDA